MLSVNWGVAAFCAGERDQSYMMPPSMRDWLSEGHLAWFIVDAVGQMDVREFYATYRSDGWGAAAYDPGMMVAILLYAYCLGLRSSRRIARALEEDVGFRVVANRQPDFRTICRFRAEQEEALEELFVEVVRLCHEAGLVKLGVVALDGTKVAADAELATNRSHQAIEEEVQRMLAEAKAADAEEDAHYGPGRRGDELPEGLGRRRERLKRVKEAKERLQREAEAAAKAVQEHVEQRRAEEVATGKKKRGRKPKVVEPLPTEEAKANTTDPDSRIMKTRQEYVQGYNAQAVVSEEQIIVAVERKQRLIDNLTKIDRLVQRIEERREPKYETFHGTEAEAQARLAPMQAESEGGEPTAGTIEAMLADWLRTEQHRWKAATFVKYEGLIRHHIVPFIGERSVTGFTKVDGKSFYATLRENGRTENTVRFAHKVLSMALTSAVDDEVLERYPVDRVKLGKIKVQEVKPPDEHQVNDMLAMARESGLWWYPAIRLAGLYGYAPG